MRCPVLAEWGTMLRLAVRGLELSPVWHTAGTSGGGPGDKTGHTTVTGEQAAREASVSLSPHRRRQEIDPRLGILIKSKPGALPRSPPGPSFGWQHRFVLVAVFLTIRRCGSGRGPTRSAIARGGSGHLPRLPAQSLTRALCRPLGDPVASLHSQGAMARGSCGYSA